MSMISMTMTISMSDDNEYDINNYGDGNDNDEGNDNDVLLTVPHGHAGPGEVLSIEEVEGRLSFHLLNRSYLKVGNAMISINDSTIG